MPLQDRSNCQNSSPNHRLDQESEPENIELSAEELAALDFDLSNISGEEATDDEIIASIEKMAAEAMRADDEPINTVAPPAAEPVEVDRSVKAAGVDLPECQNDISQTVKTPSLAPETIATSADNNGPSDLPDCQNEGGAFDKSVSAKRYVSSFRDAQFMRNLKAYYDFDAPVGGAPLLVAYTSPPQISPTPSSTPSQTPSSSSASTTSIDEATRSLLNHTSARAPWWDAMNRDAPLPPPARQYRTPAPWRDTSDELKVTFRHIALDTLGSVCTLNLNLSPEIEALARTKKAPINWLHRRISDELKKGLQRPVEFHLILEEGEHHRLHLHGEFQIAPAEAEEARAALRKAGGVWGADDEALAILDSGKAKKRGGENHQAYTASNPDRGWVDYLVGDFWRVSFTRKMLPRYVPTFPDRVSTWAITFEGEVISSTELLNAAARAIYEQHRLLVLECLKKPKSRRR